MLPCKIGYGGEQRVFLLHQRNSTDMALASEPSGTVTWRAGGLKYVAHVKVNR